jgi:ribose-phosphate pyrophosphokinase
MIEVIFKDREGKHRVLPYNRKVFSGGEEHVMFTEPLPEGYKQSELYIIGNIKNSSDLFIVALLRDAIERTYPHVNGRVHLQMMYLPYARQDRVCNFGESFSLGVAARFINSMRFKSVEIWDCHSDVGATLIHKLTNHDVTDILSRMCLYNEDARNVITKSTLVAPDAGAAKKVYQAAEQFSRPFLQALKQRDPLTREITGTFVATNERILQPLLVVDDICDGGRTFLGLAKELREITPMQINLYITHGIFSYDALDKLLEPGMYDNVLVANDIKNDRLFQVYNRYNSV